MLALMRIEAKLDELLEEDDGEEEEDSTSRKARGSPSRGS
jgi:hypothetical protein